MASSMKAIGLGAGYRVAVDPNLPCIADPPAKSC